MENSNNQQIQNGPVLEKPKTKTKIGFADIVFYLSITLWMVALALPAYHPIDGSMPTVFGYDAFIQGAFFSFLIFFEFSPYFLAWFANIFFFFCIIMNIFLRNKNIGNPNNLLLKPLSLPFKFIKPAKVQDGLKGKRKISVLPIIFMSIATPISFFALATSDVMGENEGDIGLAKPGIAVYVWIASIVLCLFWSILAYTKVRNTPFSPPIINSQAVNTQNTQPISTTPISTPAPISPAPTPAPAPSITVPVPENSAVKPNDNP